MDTRELESAIRGNLGGLVNYVGVFSSDHVGNIKIPLRRDKALAFIANTLESSSDINNMGHWVCFYITKSPNNHIVFFDSYGLDPVIYTHNFQLFLNRNKYFKIFEFKKSIQPDNSYKCGLYVLFFIHNVSHYGIRQTLVKIRSTFSNTNLHENDKRVVRYYFTHLKRRRCIEWKSGEKRAITYGECLKVKDIDIKL